MGAPRADLAGRAEMPDDAPLGNPQRMRVTGIERGGRACRVKGGHPIRSTMSKRGSRPAISRAKMSNARERCGECTWATEWSCRTVNA